MSGFKKAVFQGIAWRSSVDIGQQVLLIAFTAVLARILTKADFGLVAMALLFIRLAQTLTQIGFGTAIIQSQEVSERQISAVFVIQVAINLLASVLAFLGAPLAARFFHQDALVPIIRVLGWSLFINSLAFPQIILRKRLRFAGYSFVELATNLAGQVLGVIMALQGFGVWSLVWRTMSTQAIFCIAVWPLARWFPVRPSFKGMRKIFRFGMNMLGSSLSYYFSQNLAAIITGKFLGVEILGAFNIAYNLAIVPAQKVQGVLTTVLHPAFSKIQSDIRDFREKLYASLFGLGILFVPFMMGLSAVGINFVPLVYGEKWKEAGFYLTFLSFIGLSKGFEHLLRSAILAKGDASFIFKITLAETLIGLPLLFLGSYIYKAIGVIIAYMIASFFAFALTLNSAQGIVQDRSIFWRAVHQSFLAASVMFLVVFGFAWLSPFNRILTLGIQIALGVIVYFAMRIKFLTRQEKLLVSQFPLAHLVFRTI